MNKANHTIILVQAALILVITAFFAAGCGNETSPAKESEPPAKVMNAVEESSLASVILSEKAEGRLGVVTVPVESRRLPGSLKLGGEIIPLPGNEAVVSAPLAGTILPPENGRFPSAGKILKKGDPIIRLMLLPPEKDLLGAREEVAVKQKQNDLARSKAARAETLLKTRAISEKEYEEIQVEVRASEAALKTARARLNLLNSQDVGTAASGLSTLVLRSPVNGALQRILVAAGETVPASAELFEVSGWDPVWIKVPVYVGDLAEIDKECAVTVTPLGTNRDSQPFQAQPVQGPPLSDADSVTSFLFYRLENPEKIFRIGQKVGITLIKESPEASLSIPLSAILYDIHGGTWVYSKTAPHVYTRIRVEVSHFVDERAVITRGVKAGDEVVTDGAAEIFGTEFGVGK